MRHVITLIVIAACGRPGTTTHANAKRDGGGPVAPCVAPAIAPLGAAVVDTPLVGKLAAVAPSIDALAPPRPVFRFRRPPGTRTARVEVCADRRCKKVLATLDAPTTSAQPPTPFAPGRVFWRVVTPAGATPARPLRIRATGDSRGAALVRGLDWNGDGYVDHLRATGDAIDIWLGSAQGLRSKPLHVALPAVAAEVAPAGDLDGDGFDDLVVGAPDVLSTGAPKDIVRAGAAFVVWGGPQGRAPHPIRVADTGRLGSSVAIADLDDDGWNDVIVAAEGISLPASATVIPPAAVARVVVVRGGPDKLGDPIELARGVEGVRGAGDLEGTGHTGLALRVRLPGLECLATDAGSHALDVSVHGGGNGLVVVPDLDGDGRDDMLYGDLLIRDTPGGMQVWRTLPHAIARVAGDFDGNGRFELAALALGGGVDLFDRDSLSRGATPVFHLDDITGQRLDTGDVDGDGFDDLVVDREGAAPMVIAGTARGLRR